ncbi:MAG TPA: HEAT repeat domain-containing protein [Planctomycetota bacterium]
MLLLLACLLGQDLPPKGPPDWKVEVVAKFPEIKHPSVVTVAPDGRIFVAEDPMDMGEPSHIPVDRILCLHPDGRVSVYAEKLYAVFGMAYVDGKLYVHHTPRFSVFTDDQFAGKDRVDLIECTNPHPAGVGGGGFNDHIPSNCRLAMDGFLYVSIGDKGLYGAVGKDGKKAEIYGGGLFRIRPDGTDMEVVSTGTRNHLDVAINSEDEMFTYDNTDDGHGWWTRVTHMVDGGSYGYPWDYKPRRPYTLWMMGDFGGGSGTGSTAYNEDALPAEYHGNLFLSEWTRKQFIRLKIAREGASYKIVERQDFLTQQGTQDFRPVGSAVSADGKSIYVCDWNFGGWKQKDKETGRLIKATYTGPSQAAPKPAWFAAAGTGKPFEATTAELIAALGHPAQSVRMIAQRRLVDRKAVKELREVTQAPAAWHAIWALDALGVASVDLLKSPDPSVRRQAARQAGTRRVREAGEALVGLLKDPDLSVRFQAATALGRVGSSAAVPALQAALEETDLFARYAAFLALNRIGRSDSTSWASIVKGLESPSERIREGTRFALRETYDPALVEALAASPTAASVTALAEIHRMPPAWTGKWWGTQPVAQPRPAKTVDYPGTARVLATIRAALASTDPATRVAAIDAVPVVKDVEAAPVLRALWPAADVATKKAILRALSDPASGELVAGALKDPALRPESIDAAERIKLVDALIEALPDSVEALGRLKASKAAGPLAALLGGAKAKEAVAALTLIGGDAAVKALLAALDDKRAELRRAAVGALGALKAKDALPALLRAYLDPETRFEAVGALAQVPDLRALDAYVDGLGGKNATVRQACATAVAAIHASALPLLEAKLARQELPGEAILELQRIYNKPAPVLDWRLAGPMKMSDAAPAVDAEYVDARGKPGAWKKAKVKAEFGEVELRGQMPVQDGVAAFAYTEIESAEAREVEFLCGADDTFTLWVNGVKLFEDLRDGGWKADEIKVRAPLKAGKNAILVRCGNTGGGWEFSVAIPGARKGALFEAKAKKLDPAAYEKHAASNKGDAGRGRALFADLKGVACVKCHKVKGDGGEVGPELFGVAAKFNRAQLVESVLYPSKQILDGYKLTKVLTTSGEVKSGRLAADGTEELILLDAEGKRHAIKKGEIDRRQESDLSLMPDGLNTGLTPQDFSDLIAYLETLK